MASTTDAAQLRKIEQLRLAIDKFQAEKADGTSTFFDKEKEEKKATVRRRALLLLDQRARSTAELRTRLKALEFEEDIIEEVIQDFLNSNLLDDESFAMEWVRQRSQRRGKSSRVLDQELRDKGIAQHVRTAALEQIDGDAERETAWAVARKKARSESKVPQDRGDYDKALRRVLGALARRGFPAGLSMQLARQALDERLEELKA
ncbi:recombination regulator RecX [Corynebacterium callunae]|uniref:recombination regulator RecX n=1 Tax=Corynebacterium callunae TaxID=1721 RepID=UPI003981F69E